VGSWPWVSRVSTSEPCQRDRARGVVLVGSFRHGLLRIAFTAFRSASGVTINFPCRGSRPLAWPADEPARAAVVGKLIEILRAKGKLPPSPHSRTTRTSGGAS
jgi:hypothetical protein